MSKLPLPARFEDDNTIYSLVYFPGLPADADARYAMRPNVIGMHALGGSDEEVVQLGGKKKHMTWVMMQDPAQHGKTIPARNFLFFQFADHPLPLRTILPHEMICYAATPKRMPQNPAQSFLDAMFGQVSVEAEASRPSPTWATELFSTPDEDTPSPAPDLEGEEPEGGNA